LEWIPFEKLKNINCFKVASRSTLYSAVWIDGPRILWDQQNQEYKRSEIQVLVKLYDEDQVYKILNEVFFKVISLKRQIFYMLYY